MIFDLLANHDPYGSENLEEYVEIFEANTGENLTGENLTVLNHFTIYPSYIFIYNRQDENET